jgi:predicted negative regulator of RcsB-dependent stress response
MQSDVTHSAGLFSLLAWFEKNRKPVMIGTASAAIVGLVAWFMIWQKGEKEIAAGQELSRVEMQFGPGQPGQAEAYLQLATKYSGSEAGAQALLLGAGALFTDGKFDRAKAEFQRFIRDYRDSQFVNEAYLGLAACLDALKSPDAITAYKDVIDHHASDTVIPEAKFSLARLYVAQNKPELARDLFEEVERLSRYGVLGQEAAMRVAELEASHPELVPKPPANLNPALTPLSPPPAPASSNPAPSTATPAPVPASPPTAASPTSPSSPTPAPTTTNK